MTTASGKTLDFIYDASGAPYALKYNGTVYYYVTNLQGDVIRLVDSGKNTVASYQYDPYGKVISATGTMAEINPLRYRGYYYDTETGFYYLNSRYYDPSLGRFINADSYASTGQGIIGYNMFAYYYNCPATYADISGRRAVCVIALCDGDGIPVETTPPTRKTNFLKSSQRFQKRHGIILISLLVLAKDCPLNRKF